MRRLSLLACFLAAAVSAQPSAADRDPSPHSDASLVADAPTVRAGGSVEVALRLDVEPGWHVYWINPGDSGLPVEVAWTLPDGVTAGPLRFPAPERLSLAGLTSFAHEGEVWFLSRVAVPEDASGTVRLAAHAAWLICADVCLPAEQDVTLDLPVGDGSGGGRLAQAQARLPVAAEGWTASAAQTPEGLLLTLAPPPGWTGTLEGADFFPAATGTLDHSVVPAFQREGAAWAVLLPVSPFAEDAPERLRGLLVAREGVGLVGDARAVEIDAVVAPDAAASADLAATLVPAGGTLAGMLLLAFVGGLILNLMPCVFPILSIKILGFAETREPAALRRHGIAFAAGVLVSFWALAGLLLALRASGAALGWGFQLQTPLVVAALAALMVVLALGLFGVVEIGTGVASAGARLDRREGVVGAFLSGVLAVVVASPCTAPFMGAALGYALAQPAVVALAVFTALGVGMALPYVALAFAPRLTNTLPRPGPWMETLKQGLAFPLLLTAVWLVWVFGRQTGIDGAAALLVGLVALGLAVWVIGRWPAGRLGLRGKLVTRSLAVVLVAGAVAVVAIAGGSPMGIFVTPDDARSAEPTGGGEAGWRPFDPAEVDRLVADGQAVFVDYTAAWCLTCQVNKRTTLRTAAVEQAFRDGGVVLVQADWTARDPAITASLDGFGRSGVPLYVLYPGGGAAPVLLPEVLTPRTVLDALAAGRQTAGRTATAG